MNNEFIEEALVMTCNLIGLKNQPIKSVQENIITLLDTIHTEVFHKQLIYGLARLPLVNCYAMAAPTALQLGWEVGQELPNSLLKERSVIEEGLIKRTNQIGQCRNVNLHTVTYTCYRLVVKVTI